MIAVSLNVGGGVRLIKPAKLYICTQKHYKHNEDGRTAPDVCGNGSVPLSHSENVVTRIGIQTQYDIPNLPHPITPPTTKLAFVSAQLLNEIGSRNYCTVIRLDFTSGAICHELYKNFIKSHLSPERIETRVSWVHGEHFPHQNCFKSRTKFIYYELVPYKLYQISKKDC